MLNTTTQPTAKNVLPDNVKEELTQFFNDTLLPGGYPKLSPIEDVTILALSVAAGVPEALVRDFVKGVYLQGVNDASRALMGARDIIKLHEEKKD